VIERRKSLAGTLLLSIVLLAAIGCGSSPQRSAAGFCRTFKTEAVRLHDKYEARAKFASTAQPLVGLVSMVGTLAEAQGDLVTMLVRLDKVAPDSIEPDVAAAHDALKKQADHTGQALTNPLAALGEGVVNALTSAGSFQQVNTYIKDNCDLSFMKSG